MNLNQTDLGHFIDQLTTASKYFGFSETDASTLNTFMNAKYNVRCAPPANGQLNSLCQATECPLAAPSAACDYYVNIGPSGVGNGTAPPAQTGSPSASASTSASSTSATAAATSSAGATTTSGTALSTGTIAGIAIGSAAVLLFAVGLLIFFLRRPAKQPALIPVPYPTGGGYASPSHPSYMSNPHTSFSPSAAGGATLNPHDSYAGYAGAPGFYAPKPDDQAGSGYNVPVGQHPHGGEHSPRPQPQQMAEIAEMDSPQHGVPMRHSVVPPSASPSRYTEPTWESGHHA